MGGEAALWLDRALLACAIVLLTAGAAASWISSNAGKRIGGAVVAWLGAIAALAALRAPEGLLVAGAAAGFAQVLVSAALMVRVQEAYGAIEAPEIDAADAQSEPPERRA
jgi:hypothetical protein